MWHKRSRRDIVVEAVALARQLPEPQQQQTLAALLGLGNRFLAEQDLDTLLEGLMSTNLGERLINRGLMQGRILGQQQAVLHILNRHFSEVPQDVSERIMHIDNLDELDRLFDAALDAQSLDEFTRALEPAS